MVSTAGTDGGRAGHTDATFADRRRTLRSAAAVNVEDDDEDGGGDAIAATDRGRVARQPPDDVAASSWGYRGGDGGVSAAPEPGRTAPPLPPAKYPYMSLSLSPPFVRRQAMPSYRGRCSLWVLHSSVVAATTVNDSYWNARVEKSGCSFGLGKRGRYSSVKHS